MAYSPIRASSRRPSPSSRPTCPRTSGIMLLGIVPVAPASRSASSVTPSSPSNGPSSAVPTSAISALLGRRARRRDLDEAHRVDLRDQARQARNWERHAAHRGVLDHDRDIDGVRHHPEERDRALFSRADSGPMIGRHQHHHRGPQLLCAPAARGHDPCAGVACRHDGGNASGHVLQDRSRQQIPLVVGEGELLGVVDQDADPDRRERRSGHRSRVAGSPGRVRRPH